ncbi:hypothetical protein EDD21DRAFT_58242 [Dissophora ornata]|nr:hypothetical protein EDD21DRAFT_58242 [Dissophora ornata]
MTPRYPLFHLSSLSSPSLSFSLHYQHFFSILVHHPPPPLPLALIPFLNHGSSISPTPPSHFIRLVSVFRVLFPSRHTPLFFCAPFFFLLPCFHIPLLLDESAFSIHSHHRHSHHHHHHHHPRLPLYRVSDDQYIFFFAEFTTLDIITATNSLPSLSLALSLPPCRPSPRVNSLTKPAPSSRPNFNRLETLWQSLKWRSTRPTLPSLPFRTWY